MESFDKMWKRLLLSLLYVVLGYALLAWIDFRIMLGVFLVHYSINLMYK